MKVLLDANVLVSAALPDRIPPGSAVHSLLRLAAGRRFTLLLAAESIEESRSILTTKPWFVHRVAPGSFDEVLDRFRSFAVFLPGLAYPPPSRCRDRKDDYLLEQAIRFRADILVTGDDDLLALDDSIDRLRILRPRALLDELTAAES